MKEIIDYDREPSPLPEVNEALNFLRENLEPYYPGLTIISAYVTNNGEDVGAIYQIQQRRGIPLKRKIGYSARNIISAQTDLDGRVQKVEAHTDIAKMLLENPYGELKAPEHPAKQAITAH